MNYSEPLFSQFAVFFKSIGLGVILGMWYILICFLRTAVGEKRFIYVTFDIIFALSSAVISFMFMVLFNSGKIRLNLMFGELCGAVAFYFGIGKYILAFLSKWVWIVRKVLKFIFSPLGKLKEKISALFRKIKDKITTAIKSKAKVKTETQKNKEKFFNIGKIHLKNKNKSV